MEQGYYSLFCFTILSFCGIMLIPILINLIIWGSIAILTIFWIAMLIDSIKRKENSYKTPEERLTWILVIALTHFIGAILYYFMVKTNN